MTKPFAITLDVGSSLANRTGSWRTVKPVYVNRLPPCNAKCPAGEQCQAWLFHAESGDYRGAWEKITEDNPFPACMGRVCYHTCESACNRGELDESVGINAVERFLGDHALEKGWAFEKPAKKTGKRILVVGSGPAGLSAAYHLARMGHDVHVVESSEQAGGMMRYGIPKYRLPREILDREIARIEALGVEIETGREVKNLAEEMEKGGYDAVFLGVGASLARRAYIPTGGRRARVGRRLGPAEHGRGGTRHARAPRGRLRRRQHGRRRGAFRAPHGGGAHHGVPPHARKGACARV